MKVVKRISNYGEGLFAITPIERGEKILPWKGMVTREYIEINRQNLGVEHVTHIGENIFTIPSGDLDDYVNHSCDPNCGLLFEDTVWLTALRDIDPGEELYFDYSTTMSTEDIIQFPEWKIPCLCKSPRCRKMIDSFDTIPVEQQELYRSLNMIPDFLR